jgi:hypothetical protein
LLIPVGAAGVVGINGWAGTTTVVVAAEAHPYTLFTLNVTDPGLTPANEVLDWNAPPML